jgi:uncharacterized protein (TIGR03086 family)
MTAMPPAAGVDDVGLGALDAYRRILSWSGARVSGTTTAQLALPSPCLEWDVEALLHHLFGTVVYYTLLAEDVDMDRATISVPSVNDGNHRQSFRRLGQEALDAWSRPGVLDRPCHHALLGSVPGSLALGIHAADNLVHGWDLAVATGQGHTMDPACARFALDVFERVLAGESSRRRHFGPALPADEGADVQTRLLSFVGRSTGEEPGNGAVSSFPE